MSEGGAEEGEEERHQGGRGRMEAAWQSLYWIDAAGAVGEVEVLRQRIAHSTERENHLGSQNCSVPDISLTRCAPGKP